MRPVIICHKASQSILISHLLLITLSCKRNLGLGFGCCTSPRERERRQTGEATKRHGEWKVQLKTQKLQVPSKVLLCSSYEISSLGTPWVCLYKLLDNNIMTDWTIAVSQSSPRKYTSILLQQLQTKLFLSHIMFHYSSHQRGRQAG